MRVCSLPCSCRKRAPDALNIAIAQRCGAALFTFDNRMAMAAKALGLTVMA